MKSLMKEILWLLLASLMGCTVNASDNKDLFSDPQPIDPYHWYLRLSSDFTIEEKQIVIDAANEWQDKLHNTCPIYYTITTDNKVSSIIPFYEREVSVQPGPLKVFEGWTGWVSYGHGRGAEIVILPMTLFRAYTDDKLLDYKHVAMHELGHSFKMQHRTTGEHSVMYFTNPGDIAQIDIDNATKILCP
jgi:hypothetical protein